MYNKKSYTFLNEKFDILTYMKTLKKESADSGLFCFRLNKSERDQLNIMLDEAKFRLNKNRAKDE